MKRPPGLWRVAQIVIGSLLAVTLLIVGIGALLPHEWQVEESILINAPADSVHAWVNDLRRWPRWAQWNQAELWPRNVVSEPSVGPGASLRWHGRARSGADLASGETRIVRSDPHAGVWFESRTGDGPPSEASVRYSERPGVTLVTWHDRGHLPPVIGGLFLDLFQKRLHDHMSTGLERLKDLVEANPAGAADAPAGTVLPGQVRAE
jgi:uncharacterized membrane protein